MYIASESLHRHFFLGFHVMSGVIVMSEVEEIISSPEKRASFDQSLVYGLTAWGGREKGKRKLRMDQSSF